MKPPKSRPLHPSRTATARGSSSPYRLHSIDPIEQFWAEKTAKFNSVSNKSSWIQEVITFDGKIPQDIAFSSLDPREKDLLNHIYKVESPNTDILNGKSNFIDVYFSLTRCGKLSVTTSAPEDRSHLLRTIKHEFAVSKAELTKLDATWLAFKQETLGRARQCLKLWVEDGSLDKRIDNTNAILREIPPIFTYWDGNVIQNFRDPLQLPNSDFSGNSELDFRKEQLLSQTDGKLIFFTLLNLLRDQFNWTGIELLNGRSLNFEVLDGQKSEIGLPCRRIEGIRRRKIPSAYTVSPSVSFQEWTPPVDFTSPSELLTDYHSYVIERLESLRVLTDSEAAMTRGFRRVGALANAIQKADFEDLLASTMEDHFCWLVADEAGLDQDSCHAIESRMRYNSWHLQPWGKDSPSSLHWPRLQPPTVPDISSHVGFHHPGHVSFLVNQAIRVPFDAVTEQNRITGVFDVRLMRTTDIPYDDLCLANAVALTEALQKSFSRLLEIVSEQTQLSAEDYVLPASSMNEGRDGKGEGNFINHS